MPLTEIVRRLLWGVAIVLSIAAPVVWIIAEAMA